MCITSGCDYLPSLHGVGLGKALKFWSRVTDPELTRVLRRIPAYLNMHQLKVDREYVTGFVRAERTFLYQLVFDTRTRRMRPLTEYPSGEDLGDLSFAGEMIEDDLAFQVALGNVDLRTLRPVRDFDPDRAMAAEEGGEEEARRAGRTAHASIWDPEFDPRNRDPRVSKEEAEERRRKKEGLVRTAFGDISVNKNKRKRSQQRQELRRVGETDEEGDGAKEEEEENRLLSRSQDKRPKVEGKESTKFERKKGGKGAAAVVVHSKYFVGQSRLEEMNSGRRTPPENAESGGGVDNGEKSVCTQEEEEEKGDPLILREKSCDDNDGSRCTKAAVGKEEVVESPEGKGEETKERSPGGREKRKRKNNKKPPSSTSHSWLDLLDDQTTTSGKIIYNTDIISDSQKEDEANSPAKDDSPPKGKIGLPSRLPPLLPGAVLRSSEASRRPFRPVVAKEGEDEGELRRRRNPFLKKKNKEDSNNSQDSVSSSCSPPKTATFSQASIDQESFNLEGSVGGGGDSAASTPASSQQPQEGGSQDENREPSSPLPSTSAAAAAVEKEVVPASSSKSSYFSSPPSPRIRTKPSSARQKGHKQQQSKGQRSVLDMWTKI